jgi:hypothetical protein
MYFLGFDCTDAFIQVLGPRDNVSEKMIPNRLAVAQAHQPFLTYSRTSPQTPDRLNSVASHSIQAMPLAQFKGAEQEEKETLLFYKMSAMPPSSKGLQ